MTITSNAFRVTQEIDDDIGKDETWNVTVILDLVEKCELTEDLPLKILQQKTLILLGIATMWRPRSDLGRLQYQDVSFTFQDSQLMGARLISRKPKESKTRKVSKLGTLEEHKNLCPVYTLYTYNEKTKEIRRNLPKKHTLFLAYIDTEGKTKSVQPSTVSNWVKAIMEKADIDTKKYTAYSLRSAASTFAVQQGNSIETIKKHAGWSTNSNAFEIYYYKPFNGYSTSSDIKNTIFLNTENTTTISPLFTSETV